MRTRTYLTSDRQAEQPFSQLICLHDPVCFNRLIFLNEIVRHFKNAPFNEYSGYLSIMSLIFLYSTLQRAHLMGAQSPRAPHSFTELSAFSWTDMQPEIVTLASLYLHKVAFSNDTSKDSSTIIFTQRKQCYR